VSYHPPRQPQAEVIADSPLHTLQVRRGTNLWTPIPSGASGKSTSCRRAARCARAGGAYGPVIRAAMPKAAVLGAVRVSPRYICPLGYSIREKHGPGRRICCRRSGRTKVTSPSAHAGQRRRGHRDTSSRQTPTREAPGTQGCSRSGVGETRDHRVLSRILPTTDARRQRPKMRTTGSCCLATVPRRPQRRPATGVARARRH